ncbi:MAG: hypothetical protein KDK65_00695 [Chlamydiia bacterium]|nr:hypothetical protein [Chlamydiia bacterium]
MTHHFLLEPGQWLGEGEITFSTSPDQIRFYTRWEIEKGEHQGLDLIQQVELQDVEDHVHNRYSLFAIQEQSFEIALENEHIGTVMGKGVIDQEKLAWEFREQKGFEGFEIYQLTGEDTYSFHAEYLSGEHFRTLIDGRIWRKTEN